MLITLTKKLYYICKNCSETDKEIEEIMSSEMSKDICQSCKKRTKQKEIFLRKQMEEEAVKQEAVIIQLQQENTKKADDIKLKAKTIKKLGDVVKQHEVTAQTIRNENSRLKIDNEMLADCVDILKEKVEETKAKETSKIESKCHSLESEVEPTRSSRHQKSMTENSHSKQGNRTKKCEEVRGQVIAENSRQANTHQNLVKKQPEGEQSESKITNIQEKTWQGIQKESQKNISSNNFFTEKIVEVPVEKIGYLIGKNGWRTKSIQAATNTVILHPVDRQNFFTIIGKYENIKQAEDTRDNMLQRSDEEHYKRLPKSTSNNRDNTYTDNRNVNYPNRYKNQKIECRYYQRGYCRFGKNCRFIHTEIGISNHVHRRRYNDLQRTHDREIRNQWQTVRSSRAMPTRR